jgi:heme/copper-type cytochrome/quinol oxidase subunit 1
VRRAGPWLITVLGAALIVAGVVVFAAAHSGSGDFGWSAYVPLSQTQERSRNAVTFANGVIVLWTGQHLVGAGLLVLGVLVLVGAGGWLLGRRAGRRSAPGA